MLAGEVFHVDCVISCAAHTAFSSSRSVVATFIFSALRQFRRISGYPASPHLLADLEEETTSFTPLVQDASVSFTSSFDVVFADARSRW